MLAKNLLEATQVVASSTINVVSVTVSNASSIFVPATSSNQLAVIYVSAINSTTTIPTDSTPSNFTKTKTFSVNTGSRGRRLSVFSRFGAFSSGNVNTLNGTSVGVILFVLERTVNPFTSSSFTSIASPDWYSVNITSTSQTRTIPAPSTSSPAFMIALANRFGTANQATSSGFGTKVTVRGSDNATAYYEVIAGTKSSRSLVVDGGATSPTDVIYDFLY